MRSYPADYNLVTPPTLDQALQLLGGGEGWRPIAGGTDLMVLFNAGRLPFQKLVSIRHLAELQRIDITPNAVLLGAAVSYTQIRNHAVLQNEFPMLCSAASWTGGIANQNRATIGGNIANASPAADSSPVLLAYDADLHLTSQRGVRRIPYKSFHLGYKVCDLAPDEIITAIELTRTGPDTAYYARKVGPRQAQAIAKVCIAARARCHDGVAQEVRLAFGSVAPIPLRCEKTESVLIGRSIDSTSISEAQAALREEISPISDMRSSDWYRAQVSINLLGDFLRRLK